LQWYLHDVPSSGLSNLHLGLADYNATVLQLVTLPNVLLSWAQVHLEDSWEPEGELEIDEAVITNFLTSLESSCVSISLYSGAWCPEFVKLVVQDMKSEPACLVVLGAETIYSPFALKTFAETLMHLMESTLDIDKIALVGAKKVYFGVGGSMEDFCQLVREKGATVETTREESDGVRRAVVEVKFPST
jgi:protein-histidine N-methyltransferase